MHSVIYIAHLQQSSINVHDINTQREDIRYCYEFMKKHKHKHISYFAFYLFKQPNYPSLPNVLLRHTIFRHILYKASLTRSFSSLHLEREIVLHSVSNNSKKIKTDNILNFIFTQITTKISSFFNQNNVNNVLKLKKTAMNTPKLNFCFTPKGEKEEKKINSNHQK